MHKKQSSISAKTMHTYAAFSYAPNNKKHQITENTKTKKNNQKGPIKQKQP